ncbi:MAG: hypothetical protein ACOYD0_03685 [Candidatus Nanopelagicales bacterium]
MTRRTVVALGSLALVVVCILIAVLVRTRPAPSPGPEPLPSPSTTVTQKTIFTAVRDDTDAIAGAMVLGTDATPATGSWLSLQPGLGVDVESTGTVTLAEVGPRPVPASTALVSNQLGVVVQGGWIMDRLALAAMVDAVGGVTLELTEPVVRLNPDGTKTVLAKPGTRRVFGPAAAEYAIALGPKEPQVDRMARFDEVWGKVIRQLPGNVDRVRSIVGSLGSSSRITVSPDYIANALLEYQTALAERATTTTSLPVSGSDTGPEAIFTQNPQSAFAVVSDLFGPSLPVVGENGALPRIRMVSEGISSGSFVAAKEAVVNEGNTFVWGGQRPRSTKSRVFVANQAARESLGVPLATALGLPKSAVQVSRDQVVGVQATVLLGLDVLDGTASPATSPGTMSATPKPTV